MSKKLSLQELEQLNSPAIFITDNQNARYVFDPNDLGGNEYFVNPILGVFNDNFPNNIGDRYIDSNDPTLIKVVGFVDQPFPDGAIAQVIGENKEIIRVGSLIEERFADPVLTTVSSIGIYLDSASGSDDSADPTSSNSPFKTVSRAKEFLKQNYTFGGTNNNRLTIYFSPSFNFAEDEDSSFVEEDFINGDLDRITFYGNPSNPSVPSTIRNNSGSWMGLSFYNFYQTDIVVQNIDLDYGSLSFRFCDNVNLNSGGVYGGISAQNCNSFSVTQTGNFSFLLGCYFSGCNSVNLNYPSQSSYLGEPNFGSSVVIENCLQAQVKGTFSSKNGLSVTNCNELTLGRIVLSATILSDPSAIACIVLRNIAELKVTRDFTFEGNQIRRTILDASDVGHGSGTMNCKNLTDSPIAHNNVEYLFSFYNCGLGKTSLSAFRISAASDSQSLPVFSNISQYRFLIKMDGFTADVAGNTEDYLLANICSSPFPLIKKSLNVTRLGSDFDNTGTSLASTTVEDAIKELALAIGNSSGSASISLKLKGTAQTNLNSTVAGTPVVFDAATAQGDTALGTTAAAGITIDSASAGTYLVYFTLNTSVPANGIQRASVAVRITVNGSQQTMTGRNGYIRRNSGHNEATSHVVERLTLAEGDTVGAIGFRDAIAGTVTAIAQETELLLVKLK